MPQNCRRTPQQVTFNLRNGDKTCRVTFLDNVLNPLSRRDRGTFESNAVRSKARAASLIAQFSRSPSWIRPGAGPEARAGSLYRSAITITNSRRGCKIHAGTTSTESLTAHQRQTQKILKKSRRSRRTNAESAPAVPRDQTRTMAVVMKRLTKAGGTFECRFNKYLKSLFSKRRCNNGY
jgi:hypothetical protein